MEPLMGDLRPQVWTYFIASGHTYRTDHLVFNTGKPGSNRYSIGTFAAGQDYF